MRLSKKSLPGSLSLFSITMFCAAQNLIKWNIVYVYFGCFGTITPIVNSWAVSFSTVTVVCGCG